MDCFEQQLSVTNYITEDVYNQITFRRVWSGEMIQIGDKVVYGFVFDPKDDQLKLASFIDRELGNISNIFDVVGFKNVTIPVLKFKNDAKKREYKEANND